MLNILREFVYRLRGEYTTEKLIKMGLTVGSNFSRQGEVIIDPSHCWLIDIGDNVTIAPRVHILAHDASTKQYLGYTKIGHVKLGNNVFIGANSIILPNVVIGSNVIIGAGSVVTSSIPDNCVYAGNPAKFIRSIDEFLNQNIQLQKSRPIFSKEYTLRCNIDEIKKSEMKRMLSDDCGYVE